MDHEKLEVFKFFKMKYLNFEIFLISHTEKNFGSKRTKCVYFDLIVVHF